MMAINAPCATYSLANFLLISYIFLTDKTFLYPVAITNTCAIVFTWYFAILFIDNSIPVRMIEKYKWSLFQYFIGEFIFHIIPYYVCVMFWRVLSNSAILQVAQTDFEKALIKHSGLYSMMLNLFWTIIMENTFELNDTYVFLYYKDWNWIWFVNLLSHMVPMFILNDT